MPRPSWRTMTSLITLATAVVLIPTAVAGVQSAEERQLQGASDRLAAVARELKSAEKAAEGAELGLAEADERLAAVEAVVNDVAVALDSVSLLRKHSQLNLHQSLRVKSSLNILAHSTARVGRATQAVTAPSRAPAMAAAMPC